MSTTSAAVTIRPTGGVMDTIVDAIDDRLPADRKWNPAGNHSIDWCRFRKNEHCFYPKELDYAVIQA